SGKPWEHRVEYTLGSRRFQHYLTTLPDGSIVVLSPAWDVMRKKWVRSADIGNPEEASGAQAQVWNKSCYSCHVNGEEKNFDPGSLRYRTTWQSLGIDCERCHGPGAGHAAQSTAAAAKGTIVNPARLDAARGTMICAECHSLRDIYAEGFQPGANYYDFYQPLMEYRLPASGDPAYWPDGRPRWFANEATGLWQSQCFLKGGASCVTCHAGSHNADVDRNPKLRAANNALCAKCHGAIAAAVPAHSHHAPASAGASCIACHMPATVASLGTGMRDHSMSIPVPENTVRHGIPNACNVCHKDKDAVWTQRRMTAWYGDKSRRKLIRRADAFTKAREGDAAAVPALLETLADPTNGPWIRANAAGYLGGFPNDPTAYQAVLRSFSDPEPLVRATAVSAIRPRAAQREAAAPAIAPLLADPLRTVRMNAAIAMVAMGVQPFPGEDGARYEQAKQLYRARAGLNNDDPAQQFAAGKFFFLAGDMERAAAAFRASLKLDPATPARYLLARALSEEGDFPAALETLKTIPREDPQYGAAQKLMAEVEAKDREHGGADAKFLNAQVQYQNEYYAAALADLEEALRLAPQASWAARARVYRAICLEKLARTSEAESAMRALSAQPAAMEDVDLQLAFVELLYDTGRAEESLQRIDAAIRAVPNAPMAHFWRAKVLLQLHRTAEAAAAAEESIRLQPQVPNAHNLLIRIYQMQGRAGEAAQQAEWLREYERRLKSR
ncbi:MAG TPA: tetratricopeptide repeat protein, partial [Candidatus Sulfopaludibacter sp.]|nr:tetratricopeptide repeat protein [Candidatus Sulfopaludibacter sp.]